METLLVRYEAGVLVPTQKLTLAEHQMLRVQIVAPQVCITAVEATRRVNRFLLDEVSYLLGADQPTLVEVDGLVWRTPVILTYPDRGAVGEVGFVDVDAESGDLRITPQTAEELRRHARALAERSTP